jgi:hypothetical protein
MLIVKKSNKMNDLITIYNMYEENLCILNLNKRYDKISEQIS